MYYILIENSAEYSRFDLSSFIKERNPDLDFVVDNGDIDEERSWIVSINHERYVIMRIGAPLPEASFKLELMLAKSWPLAARVFRNHKEHFIVRVLQKPNGYEAHIRVAKGELILADALVAMADAKGFIQPDAKVFASGKMLMQAAALFRKRGDVPDQIWIGLHLLDDGNGKVRLLSFGLADYVGYEIEDVLSGDKARHMAEQYIGLAKYLLENGPVVNDGDTVGTLGSRPLAARLKPKGKFAKGPVLVLEAN